MKSFNEQDPNFDANLKSRYHDELIGYRDSLSFSSPADITNLISDLKLLVAVLEASYGLLISIKDTPEAILNIYADLDECFAETKGSKFTALLKATFINRLQNFANSMDDLKKYTGMLDEIKASFDPMITAFEGFIEYHVSSDFLFDAETHDDECAGELRGMVLATLNVFINRLETENEEQQQIRIAERVKRTQEDEDKKQAVQANAVLTKARTPSEDRLSENEHLLYAEHLIMTYNRAEAELCLAVRNLIENMERLKRERAKELDDQGKKHPGFAAFRNRDNTALLKAINEEYFKILTEMLKFAPDFVEEITFDTLSEAIRNFESIREMFRESEFQLSDFVKDHDDITKWCIIEEPATVLHAMTCGSEESLAVFLKLFVERALLSKDIADLEKSKELYRKIHLVMNLIMKHSISTAILEERDLDLLQIVNDNQTSLIKLCADRTAEDMLEPQGLSPKQLADRLVKFSDLFQLSDEILLQLITQAKNLQFLLDRAVIDVDAKASLFKKILSLDEDVLAVWLSERNGAPVAKIIRTLVNFYFMPISEILAKSKKELICLLDNPEQALKHFNAERRDFSVEDLGSTLVQAIETSKGHVNTLMANGFLISLKKLNNSAISFVAKFKQLGLSLSQCRTIYDIFVTLNHKFSHCMTCQKEMVDFANYRPSATTIEANFPAEHAKIICKLLNEYFEFLLVAFNARPGSDYLPEKFSFMRELMADPIDPNLVNDTIISRVIMMSYLRTENIYVSDISSGNKHLDQLSLLYYIRKKTTITDDEGNIEDIYPELDPDESIGMSIFFKLFDEFSEYPITDVGNFSTVGENALFGAIYNGKRTEITKILSDDKVSVVGFGSKCFSYLSAAACSEKEEIYSMIQTRIIAETEDRLNTFILCNKLVCKPRELVMAKAIEFSDYVTVQALIARDIVDLKATVGGKTFLQLASSLNSAIGETIFNDIFTAMQRKPAVIEPAPAEIVADRQALCM